MAARQRFNFRDILGVGTGTTTSPQQDRISGFAGGFGGGANQSVSSSQVSEFFGIPEPFGGVSRNPWGRTDTIARHANTLLNGGTIGTGFSGDIGMAEQLVASLGGANPTAMDQLGAALMSDINNDQALRDQQYNRVNSEIDSLRGFFGGSSDAFMDRAGVDAERLQQIAGEQRSLFEQKANDALGNYEDLTAQQLSSTTAAIQRRFQNDMDMVNSGMRPDGSLMSPGEKAQARAQLNSQLNSETFTQMTAITTQFNQTRAQLSLALNEQRLNSFQVQNQMELAAAQIHEAARLQSLQFEANGRLAIAQLVRDNPQTSVSLFEGLSAMFALATAPGANNISAFNLAGFNA